MNREQSLRQLERVLNQRREALRKSLRGELERFNTADERIVGDHADQALDSDYGFINSRLAESESRELERINDALQRIREGSYGECESCGKKITLTRLRALPYASQCIHCQRDAERSSEAERFNQNWSRLPDDDDDSSFPPAELTGLMN